jgi:hypothetical protein
VDIDDLVRVRQKFTAIFVPFLTDMQLSNEFQFPIAAVHHASEAFLVPDVLKRAYGKMN